MKTKEIRERLGSLTPKNFLHLYEIFFNIYEKQQMNFNSSQVVIDIIPMEIRFPRLLPQLAPNTANTYCTNRIDSLRFLVASGAIEDFEIINRFGGQRGWNMDSRIGVAFNPKSFDKYRHILAEVYDIRTSIGETVASDYHASVTFEAEKGIVLRTVHGSTPITERVAKILQPLTTSHDKDGVYKPVSSKSLEDAFVSKDAMRTALSEARNLIEGIGVIENKPKLHYTFSLSKES